MHHIRPIIISQTGKRRLGKGFSPDEIKEAGLDSGSARKLCIPVDRKRRTSREENIEALKNYSEKAKLAKPKASAVADKKKPKN